METSRADVAVAGAGLIGTSIAWRLSQAGAQVTLFDAGRVGGEASSAGAGMLSPGGEFDRPSVWLELGVEGMRLYPTFIEELRGETNLAIDFRICGCVQLVTGEEERAQARNRAEFQSRAGIRVESTSEGLFYPEDGFVDPNDLLRALRCACEMRRVRVIEGHAVREIESSDYRAIVIAAGAWSGEIQVSYRNQPVALPGTIPIKGHLLGFQLEPGTLGPMRRHGHTYVLQRSNGFTIAGSSEEQIGFDRNVNQAVCASIHQQAAQLFPALKHATPTKRWFGFRPYSPGSEGPNIGRVPETNVWLAYGHYRNGILLAPLTARRVAEEILRSSIIS
jgi:glycine oxidase